MFCCCFVRHALALAPRYKRGANGAALVVFPAAASGAVTSPVVRLQQRRTYATRTRSTARERRHYAQPLRAPRYGTSTLVGRQRNPVTESATLDMVSKEFLTPMAGDIAKGVGHKIDAANPSVTARPMARHRFFMWRLTQLITSNGQPVRYNDAGVPVEGSLLLLPWREQLRLCAALLAAFCITKALFNVVRFELLYYGVWKLNYRNDDSFFNRLLYYTSTAMLAAGLLFSFNLNFFLFACLVGRREIAAHVMCNIFSHVIPRRTLQMLANRIGIVIT